MANREKPPRPLTSDELYDKCEGDLDPSIVAQYKPLIRAYAFDRLTRSFRKGELSTAQYDALVAQLSD